MNRKQFTTGTEIGAEWPMVNDFITDANTEKMWAKAHEQLRIIARLGNAWDEGVRATPSLLLHSASKLLIALRKTGYSPPTDVYPFPDGNIILEWRYRDNSIVSIEVEDDGKGELMITDPTGKVEFWEYFWQTEDRSKVLTQGCTESIFVATPYSFLDELDFVDTDGEIFNLAA